MSGRMCPVCRQVKIHRREVHTCGSPECVATWRSWTPAQRAASKESEPDAEFNPQDQLNEWLGKDASKPINPGSPIEEILGKK
jgi:hypothetical protein